MSWENYPLARIPANVDEEQFILSVLTCRDCLKDRRVCNIIATGTYPVYSFGNLAGKSVIVVGLNPSKFEYPEYLKPYEDPIARRENQFSYFKNVPYHHFNRLMEYFRKAEESLGKTMWDQVGYLDLVKCPTEKDGSTQWGTLDDTEREALIGNCEKYLIHQLRITKPKLVIAHGRDVEAWLTRNTMPETVKLTYVPQRLQLKGKARDEWIEAKQTELANEIRIALQS